MSPPILMTLTGAIVSSVATIAWLAVWLFERKCQFIQKGKMAKTEIIVCADGYVLLESETSQMENLAIASERSRRGCVSSKVCCTDMAKRIGGVCSQDSVLEEPMTTLMLNREEKELLRAILDERQRELFFEISRTDNRDFKTDLQKKESLLESVIAKFATADRSQPERLPR